MIDVKIEDLMESSGVKFGTSGARGLAASMTDLVCYTYTKAFLEHLRSINELPEGVEVAIAGDHRPSTPRIMRAVQQAASDLGCTPVNCGLTPSPAVALYGLDNHCPAVMVTGSHIPDDRNGIKFNRAIGEILKSDEAGIRAQTITLDEARFDKSGMFVDTPVSLPENHSASAQYIKRYLDFFPVGCLQGKTLGVYQHSAVGRDILVEILKGLGAEVDALGRSDIFIPVDTEAIRPEDVAWARRWVGEKSYDAIVSTDGDSDRPLIADESGEWFRGDVAGILAAKYLAADHVSTPVSCNSALESTRWFKSISRTKIGSPYVIASMNDSRDKGASMVVGYEANGGFLTNSDLVRDGKTLSALPTRDAVILIISVLLLAKDEGVTLTGLKESLPKSFTASDRLKNFPQERSQDILTKFSSGNDATDLAKFESYFGKLSGKAMSLDRTDGIRVSFLNGEVIHLRPSGNAPEFRCYTEASSAERAEDLNRECLLLLPSITD